MEEVGFVDIDLVEDPCGLGRDEIIIVDGKIVSEPIPVINPTIGSILQLGDRAGKIDVITQGDGLTLPG